MSASVRPLPSSSRYRVASCIAHGGMGSVYVGIQRGAGGFRRPVAIKRAHQHLLSEPDVRDMILSEARNASAVRHPNVVSVDDVEENDGELLLVMDYVEGASLSHVLGATFALAPAVSVRVALDVCAALSAIHGAKDGEGVPLGLVHRDVSPQNVLLDTEGLARLTDFGIACAHGDAKRIGEVEPPGKLGYMAPEYLKGAPSSPQSDLFALGVVLWEALAGRALFRGETTADSLRLTLECVVPPASRIDSSLPAALDRVLARCLAADPGDRYATAQELADALLDAYPEPASRSDVANLVSTVASTIVEEHRRAISVARRSGRPPTSPREQPAFDLEDEAVDLERLSMPASMSIVLSPDDRPRLSTFATLAERETQLDLPLFEQTLDRVSRSKKTIALGLALVTLVLSSTVLIIQLGTT